MSKHVNTLDRLGALTESDRAWILSKLSVSARERLLGGERSASPRERLGEKEDHDRNAASSAALKDDHAVLRRADARVIAQVLRDESNVLIAALLACHPWPWKDELLEALGPLQSEKVSKLLGSMKITPQMCAALLQIVATRTSGIEPALVVQSRTKFETLVERIGAARSQRRATRL